MSDIIIRRDENILQITMNRVAKRNALTAEMYLTMSDALDEGGEDKTIKVALIEGEGPHFSAGNDIAEFIGGSYSLDPGSPWRRFAEVTSSLR